MASYYVYSGAAGAGTGADWANAYTTLVAAMSGKAAGDTFYVAHDHDETTAGGITIGGPDDSQLLCVNRGGSVPPVAADLTTGAQIKTSGNANITFWGARQYFRGLAFIAGVGAIGGATFYLQGAQCFDACHFKVASTDIYSGITATNHCVWNNCTVEFSSTAQFIYAQNFVWKNTTSAIVGATIPSSLIVIQNSGVIFIEAVDLSAIPSGKSIFSLYLTGVAPSTLKDCKLAPGVTISAVLAGWNITPVNVIRCDSAGSNYRTERYHGVGTQTTETTIIRSGGASDGTTPISWKIVTTSAANVALPFESMPISIWNENTGGTKTITVEGIWGGGAVPDNNDLWIEVEYLGDSGSPQGSLVSSGVATILTTPSSYASSSETWGGSTTEFKMSVTTGTIQQKGPITVRVFAALPSSTFYIDPKPTVS